MTDLEKIRLGRKYALGDGVRVDFEKAHELLKDVRHMLGRDDTELLADVEFVLCEMYPENNQIGEMINYAEVLPAEISESCVRELFEKLIQKAKTESGYAKIYKALAKLENAHVDKNARNPKNICLGNNVGEILKRFGWNVSYFLEIFNGYSVENGLKPRTRQSLYQIIGGTNGMSEGAKIQFVDFINAENQKRPRLVIKRDITIKDLDMDKTEFEMLFLRPSSR